MTADKSKMTLWTRYFDSKLSRSEGRRVPKEASIPGPSLDSFKTSFERGEADFID